MYHGTCSALSWCSDEIYTLPTACQAPKHLTDVYTIWFCPSESLFDQCCCQAGRFFGMFGSKRGNDQQAPAKAQAEAGSKPEHQQAAQPSTGEASVEASQSDSSQRSSAQAQAEASSQPEHQQGPQLHNGQTSAQRQAIGGSEPERQQASQSDSGRQASAQATQSGHGHASAQGQALNRAEPDHQQAPQSGNDQASAQASQSNNGQASLQASHSDNSQASEQAEFRMPPVIGGSKPAEPDLQSDAAQAAADAQPDGQPGAARLLTHCSSPLVRLPAAQLQICCNFWDEILSTRMSAFID